MTLSIIIKRTLGMPNVLFICFVCIFDQIYTQSLYIPNLSLSEAQEIGTRIWKNECAGRIDQLTFWNKNEPFPSFGIGHFIWFPKDYKGPYAQTMPLLIVRLKKNNIVIPQWMQHSHFCPWKNRNMFYENFDSKEMVELRNLLASTVAQQALFIVNQFKKNVKKIIKSVAYSERKKIKQRFNKVAKLPYGMYILIDYFNFKGSGTNLKEQYQGYRWGLLQVLQMMDDKDPCVAHSFVESAKKLLSDRVAHAPINKPEKQFLVGWHNRIDTYLD